MAAPPTKTILIKKIAKMKEENEKLQELVNFLRQENFEYSFECNRMENMIEKIRVMTQSNPDKLVETTKNLTSLLHICAVPKGLVIDKAENFSNRKAVKAAETSPKSNKAHVVKPHMVNGTVLYIPTINLTRVADVNNPSTSRKSLQNKSLQEDNSGGALSTDESESGSSSSMQGNQSGNLEDESGASSSTSPPHSTVLSGTFQEVKIFLNQVSQDSLNGEGNRSVSLRRGSLSKVAKRRKYKL